MNIGGEFLVNFRESGSGYNVVIGNAVNFCVGDLFAVWINKGIPNSAPRYLLQVRVLTLHHVCALIAQALMTPGEHG